MNSACPAPVWNRMLPGHDKNLLNALRNGDQATFTRLYNQCAKRIFLTVYTATKSKEVAKEIVQEVFISLWVNRQTLVITSSVEGYLVGAARHKVYDHFDKQLVRTRYKSKLSKSPVPMRNSTQEALDFEELNGLVHLQLQGLPETTRKIFISNRFNGTSVSQIAEESSLSIKAVEYHLTKALKHLRSKLVNYQPKPATIILLLALLYFQNSSSH